MDKSDSVEHLAMVNT